MGNNKGACSGCVTLLILGVAGGLLIDAWQGSNGGTRAAMVVVGVSVLGALWWLGHLYVTSDQFRARQVKK